MASKRDVMQRIRDCALEVINSKSGSNMHEMAWWLFCFGLMYSLSLDQKQLASILSDLDKGALEFDLIKSGALEVRKRFYQLTKRLIADTDRIRENDLLKLDESVEKIQKRQCQLTKQIQGLNKKLNENNERQLEYYKSLWKSLGRSLENIIRNPASFYLFHCSERFPRLRELCPQMSDQEFGQKVEEVYCDANVADEQLGSALIKKLKLASKRSEVMNLSETHLNSYEIMFRRFELRKKIEEPPESLSKNILGKRKVASMSRRLSDLRHEFLLNSAEQEAGYQGIGEIVIDFREKISKDELRVKLNPRLVEYLEQVDVELAKYSPCKQDSV